MTLVLPRLEARDLAVSFGARAVLEGIDFAVAAREVAVIEGPSGGGKSTLLRTLATLQPRTRGELLLDGHPESGFAPSVYRALVAYVPQTPVMLAGTVADNVRAGPRLRGVELSDAELAILLRRAALDESLGARPARDLSGGEQQRVAIARALANRPQVMLFDEPTSALDPATSAEIQALVLACAGDGCGVVVVTHSHDQAVALAGTRYVCEGGRLTRVAAP
jgi:ABC-type iron transport system FetAB ATPase subunit